MRAKRIILFLLAALAVLPLSATGRKKDTLVVRTYTDGQLDSMKITKAVQTNDYTLIGFEYGVNMSKTRFNPKKEGSTFTNPGVFGITYTRYGKMFQTMPYFGFQVGLYFGQDGYYFKEDDEGYTPSVDGVTKAVFDYIEVPLLAHFHVDFWKMKVMGYVGPYFDYRTGVHRESDVYAFDTDYADKFFDYERRFLYGIKGGGGLGFMLDPVEIHFTAMVKYGVKTIYDPDYYSSYYYRYARQMDVVISAGVHIQLTKRTGKTTHALKREARDIIWSGTRPPRQENREDPGDETSQEGTEPDSGEGLPPSAGGQVDELEAPIDPSLRTKDI